MFRDAVRLGFIFGCQPLDEVEFVHYLDLTLAETHPRIGLEVDLLLAYYAIEQRWFQESWASRRLLDINAGICT